MKRVTSRTCFGLFNASFAKVRRVVALYEGDEIDASVLKALVPAAAALNAS